MTTLTDMFGLTGKHAFITGAAGGLGFGIAELFVNAGARVTLTDLEGPRLSQLDTHFKGQPVETFPCNLGDYLQLTALCERLAKSKVDILVCCAGIEGYVGPMSECTDEQWQALLQINLLASQKLSAAVIPYMSQQKSGRLIYVASIAGLRGNKGIGLYGIAKAGLLQLARNYAVQCGADGITANAICPGLIDTALSQKLQADPEFMQRRLQMTPLRRIGTPDEIAASTLYLASQAGGFTTGQSLVVDGGTLITDGN